MVFLKEILKKLILKKICRQQQQKNYPGCKELNISHGQSCKLPYNVVNKFLPIKTWVKVYKIISDFGAIFVNRLDPDQAQPSVSTFSGSKLFDTDGIPEKQKRWKN